jgi:ankyrin repeat protein
VRLLLLLAGAFIEQQVASAQRVLGAAAAFNRPRCMQLLLAAGADVHYRSPAGATALHYAAIVGEAAVIMQLLSAGALASMTLTS